MFTIKQMIRDPNIAPSETVIRLWEGRDVYSEFNTIVQKPNVHFTMPEGTTCSLDCGVVFVMNSAGKTVETFRLAGSDWF